MERDIYTNNPWISVDPRTYLGLHNGISEFNILKISKTIYIGSENLRGLRASEFFYFFSIQLNLDLYDNPWIS